jgi:hypothetical protein
MRERLPNRRSAITFNLDVGGMHYICTLGYYADGRLGEVFLKGAISK